jgi:hypothetical protein
MRKIAFFCLSLLVFPSLSYAQSAAPELFGVKEIITENVKFDDPKAAETCGLTRDKIASDLQIGFAGTDVPATTAFDAKPPSIGVARINFVPEISTHTDDNLNCVSWISLSAENRTNVIIQPVSTLRTVTAIYWREHILVSSNQSQHPRFVDDTIGKMIAQFVRQYKLDQPPEDHK